MAKTMSSGMKGFSQPRDRSGAHGLYGPPPWHFEGHSVTVFLRADPDYVASMVPAPLKPMRGGIVRLTSHHMTCTFGYDWSWAHRNPNLSQFHEAVVACEVEYGDKSGHLDPYCWSYSDMEMAEAREAMGWPMRYGEISHTNRPLDGWRAGQHATVIVSRYNRGVYEMAVKLKASGDLPALKLLKATHPLFYTCRMIPRFQEPEIVDVDLFVAQMENFKAGDYWHGPAEVEFHAPELVPLKTAKILGGRVNTFQFTKKGARHLLRYSETAGRASGPR
jgi:hypothetical protein